MQRQNPFSVFFLIFFHFSFIFCFHLDGISFGSNTLSHLVALIEEMERARDLSFMDIIQRLAGKAMQVFTDMPASLQNEINGDITEMITQMGMHQETAMMMMIMTRLSQLTAIMRPGPGKMPGMGMGMYNMSDLGPTKMPPPMRPSNDSRGNESLVIIPPNLRLLARFYQRHGIQVLGVLSRAIANEDLHHFLANNQLPFILRNPAGFFCGPSANEAVLSYFHDRAVAPMLADLCDINYPDLFTELRDFFDVDIDEHRFDVFKMVEAANEVVMHFFIPEGTRLVEEVMDITQPFMRMSWDNL